MKKRIIPVFIAAALLLTMSGTALAHCEIPCGIYDDEMRIELMREHITTIEKSMKMVKQLQGADHAHANQLVRWVVNKEDHANKLQEIISQYFMTQRIKLDTNKYTEKISVLHHMLIYAMRCKQSTDMQNVKTLRKLVDQFESLYFEKEKD